MHLLTRLAAHADAEAIIWRDTSFSYRWLIERIEACSADIATWQLAPGAVVALEADFSPASVAWLIALIRHKLILVPLTESVRTKREEFLAVSQAERIIHIGTEDQATLSQTGIVARHAHYDSLRQRGVSGLVLFSSGSTGASKAAVHDLDQLLRKFEAQRSANRSIAFLLFDHIGGINTLFHILSNGGCLITVRDRAPRTVLAAVDQWRADLLPTSPTFINLILLSEAWREFSLASLRTVTYGTEPMPESTLRRFHELFPALALRQTYGLSEVGILRAQSRSSDSLWVRVGGEGFETRIVNDILHIKSASAMLGYLNAPAPFSEDGWFITGDRVEVDGEYLRILGRQSEMINVGGEKVFPAEVESVILELPQIAEATVYGLANAITGMAVCARIRPTTPGLGRELTTLIKHHCAQRLQRYKVPAKIVLDDTPQFSSRFKKSRV